MPKGPRRVYIADDVKSRRLAHTDEERDRARASLRAIKVEWDRVNKARDAIANERRLAVVHAIRVGLGVGEIAKLYGVPPGSVSKLNARAHGHEPDVSRRRTKPQTEREENA